MITVEAYRQRWAGCLWTEYSRKATLARGIQARIQGAGTAFIQRQQQVPRVRWRVLGWGSQALSVKEQTVSISGHMVSVPTVPLCCCSMEAARDRQTTAVLVRQAAFRACSLDFM